MTDTASTPSGRYIPWIYVIGMLVVIAVNGSLIYYAMSTWPGMAATHPYEEGVAYNRELAAEARQEALGWNFEIRLRRGLRGLEMDVEAAGKDGAKLDGLRIAATLERPIGAPETQELKLRPAAAGTYTAPVASLPRGQWEARIAATDGAHTVYVARRLTTP